LRKLREKEFKKLVKTLKSAVSEHKHGENPLRDAKVYDYISDTLDHLSGALADRIDKCFSEHNSELTERPNPNQIAQIVSYRNAITHNLGSGTNVVNTAST
jgi:hypothetical protein